MRKAFTKWLLIWACWTFVALFFVSEVVFRGGSLYLIGTRELVIRELIIEYLWFALTPIVLWLGRRVPLENRHWKQSLLFHILASIAVALFHVAIYSFILQAANLAVLPGNYIQRFQNLLTFNFHSNLFCYWVIFGISYSIQSYQWKRENELRSAQLETKLAHSQLNALKMQLHPHFLFNTLNTISVLLEKDAKAANRMLVSLSELLRIALEDVGTNEIPLKQEIDFLKRYLKIERIRFEERLTLKINIGAETLDAQVPNMILQPLVENSIRHGIAPQIGGGTIEIGASRENGMLNLFVRDTGGERGVSDVSKLKEGIGLSNTRARLKQMYNENYSFRIKREDGFLVSIVIPFRTNAG